MSGQTETERLAAEGAIRRLCAAYARAVDRNDAETFAGLFCADAVLEGPGFRLEGIAQIRAVPAMLRQRYRCTLHLLHNQTLAFAGDGAAGETYCLAHHLTDRGGGEASDLVWAIRYQDRFVRQGADWKFASRSVLLDWTETRTVSLPAPPPGA